MKKFEANKSYRTRSICDSEMFFTYKIVKRTEKTVWTECGKQLRVGPDYRGENEIFYPHGHYSMCPIISADGEFNPDAPLRTFLISFRGREAGAIGIMSNFAVHSTGHTEKEAIDKIRNGYEHVTQLKCEEVGELEKA